MWRCVQVYSSLVVQEWIQTKRNRAASRCGSLSVVSACWSRPPPSPVHFALWLRLRALGPRQPKGEQVPAAPRCSWLCLLSPARCGKDSQPRRKELVKLNGQTCVCGTPRFGSISSLLVKRCFFFVVFFHTVLTSWTQFVFKRNCSRDFKNRLATLPIYVEDLLTTYSSYLRWWFQGQRVIFAAKVNDLKTPLGLNAEISLIPKTWSGIEPSELLRPASASRLCMWLMYVSARVCLVSHLPHFMAPPIPSPVCPPPPTLFFVSIWLADM